VATIRERGERENAHPDIEKETWLLPIKHHLKREKKNGDPRSMTVLKENDKTFTTDIKRVPIINEGDLDRGNELQGGLIRREMGGNNPRQKFELRLGYRKNQEGKCVPVPRVDIEGTQKLSNRYR